MARGLELSNRSHTKLHWRLTVVEVLEIRQCEGHGFPRTVMHNCPHGWLTWTTLTKIHILHSWEDPHPSHPHSSSLPGSLKQHVKTSSSFFKVAIDKRVAGSYNWRVLRLLKCSAGLWASACQLSAPLVLCSLRGKRQHAIFIIVRYRSVASSLLCSAGHLLLKARSAALVFSW